MPQSECLEYNAKLYGETKVNSQSLNILVHKPCGNQHYSQSDLLKFEIITKSINRNISNFTFPFVFMRSKVFVGNNQ